MAKDWGRLLFLNSFVKSNEFEKTCSRLQMAKFVKNVR